MSDEKNPQFEDQEDLENVLPENLPGEEAEEAVAPEAVMEEAPTEEPVAEAVEEAPAEAAVEEASTEPEPAEEEVSVIVAQEERVEEEPLEEEEEDDLDLPLDLGYDPNSAHDDFNWNITNKGGIAYSQEEIKSYLEQYDATMKSVVENEIVKGYITAINDGDIVLDINYKSDGLLPFSEFRDTPDLKVGDFVEVYVEQQEDIRGQLVRKLHGGASANGRVAVTWVALGLSYRVYFLGGVNAEDRRLRRAGNLPPWFPDRH